MVPITKDRLPPRRPTATTIAASALRTCSSSINGGNGGIYREGLGRKRRRFSPVYYFFVVVAGVTSISFLMYFYFFSTTTTKISDLLMMSGLTTEPRDPYMDAFWEAKRIATTPPDNQPEIASTTSITGDYSGNNSNPKLPAYLSCLAQIDPKYFKPLPGPIAQMYKRMTTVQQRQTAEKFWSKRRGKIWMQHSRKAGGTSLCMILHMNHQHYNNQQLHGVVHPPALLQKLLKQETCQISDFCSDCDLTIRTGLYSAGEFRGWKSVPRMMDCILNAQNTQRNYIELEGTVSPPDILTNPEWSNFVFISTLRHPIARIISSLRNDPPYQLAANGLGVMESSTVDGCYETKPTNPRHLTGCAHKAIAVASKVLDKCRRGIYYCYSNYYVRIFAGYHPDSVDVKDGVTNSFGQQPNPFFAQLEEAKKGNKGHAHLDMEVTRKTLEQAKRNFLRYSCVILQEDWDTTSKCMHSKLGMPLLLKSESVRYNVAGNLSVNHQDDDTSTSKTGDADADAATTTTTTARTIQYSNATFLDTFDPQEFERILQLNSLDIEFYDWAKKLILDGYFAN